MKDNVRFVCSIPRTVHCALLEHVQATGVGVPGFVSRAVREKLASAKVNRAALPPEALADTPPVDGEITED